MIAGRGYSLDGGSTAFWPIGYPAFVAGILAVVHAGKVGVTLTQVALSVGTLALVYAMAGALFESVLVARVCLLILVLSPNQLSYTSLIMSETLFTFLVLLGFWLVLVAKPGLLVDVIAGFVFGYACLVKPQACFLLTMVFGAHWVGVVLSMAASRERLTVRRFVIMHLVLAATIGCWILRNYAVFGTFVPVATDGGYNLLLGNNARAVGSRTAEAEVGAMYFAPPEATPKTPAEQELAVDRQTRAAAIRFIIENPGRFLALIPRKLYFLFRDDTEGFDWNIWGINTRPFPFHIKLLWRILVPLARLHYGLLLTLAGAMLTTAFIRALRGRPTRLPWLGCLVILYFAAISSVFYGETRYHFPIVPWISMYAALPIASLLRVSQTSA
jgi:hypothetical protein